MNNIVKTLSSAAVVLLIVIGALFGFAGLTDIDPGEVGLKIKMIGKDKGMQDDTLDTGMHWINPVTYDIATYDTRLKQYTLEDVASTTKDGQPVLVDLSLEIGLMDKGVPNLHETVGKNYFDQVVYPATRSAIRNNTSKQLSDGIYTGEGRALVQEGIAEFLKPKLAEKGIIVEVNLRDISFSNAQFVQTLEQKAMAQQQVLIKERNAKAAEHEADRMENIADGKKRVRVKQAEAKKEELRLEGEGEKLKQEEVAKGILAIAKAKAEGTRLQVNAYGSGETYASVKWAEHMGANVKVYGFPTGATGTASVMDLNGVFKGVFPSSMVGASK